MSDDRIPGAGRPTGDVDPLLLRHGRTGAWARIAREREQQLLDIHIPEAPLVPSGPVDHVLAAGSELG